METEVHAVGVLEGSWSTVLQAGAQPVVEMVADASIADAVAVPWEELAVVWGSPP